MSGPLTPTRVRALRFAALAWALIISSSALRLAPIQVPERLSVETILCLSSIATFVLSLAAAIYGHEAHTSQPDLVVGRRARRSGASLARALGVLGIGGAIFLASLV